MDAVQRPLPLIGARGGCAPQVYRCRLRQEGGLEVAVKVQRPDVLEGIMLDLHLLRLVAPLARKANALNSDLVGLVDEWGSRFVAELDYLREARNGTEFTAAMEARGITAVRPPLPSPLHCSFADRRMQSRINTVVVMTL